MSTLKRRFGFSIVSRFVASALAGTLTGTAYAQTSSGDEAGDSAVLEEITVTAQRKEENLQRAAISLTAIGGADIAADGIKSPHDLQSRMPGVQFQEAGTPVVMIRGIGTYNNQPGVDSAVLYSVDGTYLSHTQAVSPILFDLQRVEVVRGPQGTLYGRNSNGGSINFLTNRPVLGEYRGSATVSVGNYDMFGSELVGNVPFGESAALRLAFASDRADPYFDDGSQARDNYAARARFLFEPSDVLNVLATVEHSEQDATGVGNAYCPPTSEKPACVGVPWQPYGGYGAPGNFGTGGPLGINPGFQTRTNSGAYVELNYRSAIGTVTSVSSYHKFDWHNAIVWDYIDYQPQNKNTFFTQEVRLASPSSSLMSWVTGVFYAKERTDSVESYDYNGLPGIRGRIIDGDTESKAIFGEVTYPVTYALRLTAGGRYTDEVKRMPGAATVYDANGQNPATIATGQVPASEKEFTWKLGADYDLTDSNMIYGKVSTGFKSGGVNPVPPGLGLPETYAPETVKAYQLGSKNRFSNGRIQVNGEAFYYDYEGYQTVIQSRAPQLFPGAFFTTANSQRARFYGADIETAFRVFDSGTLSLAGTYLDAKFIEFIVGTNNMSGNIPQGAPKFTFNGSYSHVFPLANGGEVRAEINSQWVDDNYTRPDNIAPSIQHSYTLTGLNIGYTTPNRTWTFTGFVRNLEDDAVMRIYGPSQSRPGDHAFMLPPRMYGLSVKWSGSAGR